MDGEKFVIVWKPDITYNILDVDNPTGNCWKFPLKYLMCSAEDYTKGLLMQKLELLLIIAQSFKNAYIGEDDTRWRRW